MSNDFDPIHFLGADQLPSVPTDMPLNQAIGRLSDVSGSGLILTERGVPKNFVKVDHLVNAVVSESSRLSLFDTPIGNVVRQLGEKTTSVVPIDDQVLRPDQSAPTGEGPRVYRVASGGWYFSDPQLVAMATKRVVYVCKNKHRNADPDNGTCYYCPFPITAQIEDI
jgi:hypothetical protein